MNETIFNILVEVLGIIGIISSILSFQFKSHRLTMVFRTLNEMFFGIQYMLLGAFTGAAMNFLGSIRNICFARMVQRAKNTVPLRILFSIIFAVFIGLTWSGPKSLLSGIAKIVSTYLYGNSNTAVIRNGVLFTSSAWLIYNIYIGSTAGVLCEISTLVSIIFALLRLDKTKQKNFQLKKVRKTLPLSTGIF